MVRQVARGALALALLAFVLDSSGSGRQQPAAPDKVYYRDAKTKIPAASPVVGELKAGPGGFQIVSGTAVKMTVSPADIVKVVLNADLPGVDKNNSNQAQADEDKADWGNALKKYGDLKAAAVAKNAPEKSRRFLEYKVATTTARVADDTPDDAGWKEKAEAAAKELGQFLVAYPTGWEIWSVGRTTARIQSELGKYREASQTWARVAKAADLPADLKQEAALQEIDALIRGKQYPDAAARIAEAAKAAPAGSVKDRLAIYQIVAKAAETAAPADAVAPVEAEVGKTKDPLTRAVGYAMIGELYLAAGKPREAMWAVLWVETVYNHDRDEVAKALHRLGDIFKAQGDEERAKGYAEKLRRYRGTL